MKKIGILLAAALTLVTLSACQAKQESALVPDEAVATPTAQETQAPTEQTPAENPTQAPEATPEVTPTEEPKKILPVDFNFDHGFTEGNEYVKVTALDENGNEVWSFEDEIGAGQYDAFRQIGQLDEVYALADQHAVIGLDVYSGEEAWRNEDMGFNAGGVLIGENGKVYSHGCEGSGLFVMGMDGKTIADVNELDPDLAWPFNMAWEDGKIILHFELNEKKTDSQDTILVIDPETLEVLETKQAS